MAKKVKKEPVRKRAKQKSVRATARITATVGSELLTAVEQYAAAHRTSVSELVTSALRKAVGLTKTPVLPPGDVESAPATDPGAWGQLLAWMEEQQAVLTEIRNALGDVAASLPNDSGPQARTNFGTRIPPP